MPESAPAQLRRGSPAGRGTLLAAILASGMVFLDSTVVNVALPHLGADLHASVADLQWTIDGYLLTLAAFLLLGGALGDRYGRRRMFLFGVAGFTAASVFCGLAQNVEMLILGRLLQGAGGALLTPGSLALIQASFHADDRGRVIGSWSGWSGVSTAIGPFLGGWLIDTLSWRWIFFINVPFAVLVVFVALRWVPESRAASSEESSGRPALGGRTPRSRQFDLAGAILAALGLAGMTYALIAAPEDGASRTVWGAVLVGVVTSVLFVLVERRRGGTAMLPPALFSRSVFAVLNAYTLVVYAALGGVTFFLAVHLQNVLGYTALATGMATLPITVLLLVGSSRAGALASRIGPRLPLTLGPLTGAAGLLLLHPLNAGDSYWLHVLPGVTLFALGLTLVVAPLTASVLAAVADRFVGVASGFNNAASRVGGLLAVAALPLFVGLSGQAYEVPAALAAAFREAMFWCTGLLLVGAVLAALLVRPSRESGRADPSAEAAGTGPVR